jgi:hypothetical protein
MNRKAFASKIEVVNRRWTGETFHIPIPERTGIDLADDEIGIEIKSRMSIYANSYAIHAYQIKKFERENRGKKLFWGFFNYTLSKPVKKVKETESLTDLIIAREVIFLPWNWIKTFPISHPKTGPYVYAHAKDFPSKEDMIRYEFERAVTYLPKGSLLEEKLNSPIMIEKYHRLIQEAQPF